MGVNRASVRCASGWQCMAFALGGAALGACGGGGDTGVDAGVPMGDPATGPGGGRNLTCGRSSFPPNATFYQDISAAPIDVESGTIMAALESRNWGDSGDRQTLGIDFSFEV